MILPGANNVLGLWPAVWTMGNLGRAGYGASLDGMVWGIMCFNTLTLTTSNSGHTAMILVMLELRPIRLLVGNLTQRRSMAMQ